MADSPGIRAPGAHSRPGQAARLKAVGGLACLALAVVVALPRMLCAQESPSISKPESVEAKSSPAAAPTEARGSDGTAPARDAKGATAGGPFANLGLQTDHGPIDIRSDALDLDYKGNQVLFRGHVRATQATTSLNSETLKVVYGGNFRDIKQMIAQGNVRISQGGRWATGDRAVLNQVDRTVEMTGNPVIHDGPDQITGTRILIYLDSEKSVVEGARAVIFPRKSQTRDNESAGDHGS